MAVRGGNFASFRLVAGLDGLAIFTFAAIAVTTATAAAAGALVVALFAFDCIGVNRAIG